MTPDKRNVRNEAKGSIVYILDLFAVQTIHGGFSFVMLIHYDEAAASRSIVYGSKDDGVGDITETRKNLSKLGSDQPEMSCEVTMGSFETHFVRSNGSPSTYRLRRASGCLPVLDARGTSDTGATVTVLVHGKDVMERRHAWKDTYKGLPSTLYPDIHNAFLVVGLSVTVCDAYSQRYALRSILCRE